MIASVAPSGLPASNVPPDAGRRSLPRRGTSAAQPRRLLAPVRPGVGTEASAREQHERRPLFGPIVVWLWGLFIR